MDRRLDKDYQPDVVRTGLHDLDKAIRGGGWQRGELIILGARPGIGKTALAMQLVKNYARHQVATNPDPAWTVIFSAEMTATGLMWRALTETTHLTTGQLQDPRTLTEAQLDLVARELQALRALPVKIDDRSAPTTDQMRLTVERLQARHPVRYVVFDYLGLAGDKHPEETHRYSQIADGLKNLAKSCDVSVLALAQLNRNVESRGKGEKRPNLSDLRQSGQIEANADVVLGLYRHDYYVQKGMEPDDETLRNVAEVLVLKQRDGGTPIIPIHFTPETTSFHSIDRRNA
jgi:replicative DNA helicase